MHQCSQQEYRDNIVSRLRALALSRPQSIGLVAIHANSGCDVDLKFDYRTLDERIRALAANLQQKCAIGDRALLLLENDEHYVIAFFACLYAGLVAVPLFPPESMRDQHMVRLKAVAADASASCILATQHVLDALDGSSNSFQQTCCMAVDAIDIGHASAWQEYQPQASDIAFLQYTSGSTGTPKGVMVSHGNLMANERAIEASLGMVATDVYVSWLPLYHDMGLIGSLLQSIYKGIPFVLMTPKAFLERPMRWLQALARHRGTVSGGPDFSYRLCMDRIKPAQLAGIDLSCWRMAYSGAEPIRAETLSAFASFTASIGFLPHALFPCYGLAEATLIVSGSISGKGAVVQKFSAAGLASGKALPADNGTTLVSCGFKSPEDELAIMEPVNLTRLPDGEIGEIWVSGPSVTQGYWQRPAETADNFVHYRQQRWLRSGDLGFIHDGQLYVAGRRKDLIIVRGHNIYPQDIEQLIESEIEAVRKSRVSAFAIELDGRECIGLAAEISHAMQKLVPPAALCEALSHTVSDQFGEPLSVVLLLNPGGLPKTSSGKLQRSACLIGWRDNTLDAYAIYEQGRITTSANAAVPAAGAVPPQPGIEAELLLIWQQLLKPHEDSAISRNSHFFTSGGNSLTAVQLALQIREQWQIDIQPRFVFDHPLLHECAVAIKRLAGQGDAPAAQIEIPVLLAEQRYQAMPLSAAQQRQWFLWQMDQENTAYHVGGALRLHGAIDQQAMSEVIADLADRHESLRTRFVVDADGMPTQQVHNKPALYLQLVDMTPLPASERETQAAAQAQALLLQPFDLLQDELSRAALIKLSDDNCILVITAHHIITDGASMQILVDELAVAYLARSSRQAPVFKPLYIQYADYAAWQRHWLEAGERESQLAWWKGQLGDEHPVLQLPGDYPRQAIDHYTAGKHNLPLPAELVARLRQQAQGQGATLFMLLLAGFQALLHRYTGQSDIWVGMPVANRHHRHTEGITGLFVNTLVLRSQVNTNTTLAYMLSQARESLLNVQAHQDLPFEQLVEALQPERSLSHSPLFQVMMNHRQEDLRALGNLPGLRVEKYPLQGNAAQFELVLETLESADGSVTVGLSYAAELFNASTMYRLLKRYVSTLQAIAEDAEQTVGEVVLLDESEQRQLDTWSRNETRYGSDVLVHQLFEQQAQAQPDAVALIFGDAQLSYGALNTRANRLAHHLIHLGIGPESRVGIAVERSLEMVIGLLAILKAGAAYVPLDPEYPQDRLAYMMQDSGIDLLLTQTRLAERLAPAPGLPTVWLDSLESWMPAGNDVSAGLNPDVRLHPEQLAYVIYTSGSTGRPKGVAIGHRALVHFLHSMCETPGLTADDVLVAATSLSFDIAGLELYLPLTTGASIVIAAHHVARDGFALAHLVEQSQATVLQLTPSGWRMLLAGGFTNPHGKLKGLVGGEALHPDLATQLTSMGIELWDMYGPTETTIWSATGQVNPSNLHLGPPIAATQLYVLDERLQHALPGTAGELYIGGIGLARGYLGRSTLSAERFIANPFSTDGSRLYRTGDLARWRQGDKHDSNGRLEYLGRIDHQVKIRGFRIELGEIETALLAQPSVREAVVIAQATTHGARLVAYISGMDDSEEQKSQLTQAIARQLPDYMVPACIVVLDKLPLNSSGKVDRKVLPAPEQIETHAYEAPEGETEQAMASIWSEVLNVTAISRHDNFFELGGDSILSLKVAAKAASHGLDVKPRQLFEQQTLSGLAASVATGIQCDANRIPLLDSAQHSQSLPLSFAQRRQWFLWQMEPLGTAYHISGILRFSGKMDMKALRASFNHIVARHESLRTIFKINADGSPEQLILPQLKIDIPYTDLCHLPDIEKSIVAEQEIDSVITKPFVLDKGPLLRVAILQMTKQDFLIAVVVHHIVSDGWSMQVIVDEFASLYHTYTYEKAPVVKPLLLQYVDYAAWQLNWLAAGASAEQLEWWQGQLGEEQPILQLATDAPRRSEEVYQAARHEFVMPQQLTSQLKKTVQKQQSTLFSVLLAGFQALLHRYTGQSDIRIGSPITNRSHPGTEQLVGFFVNTLVLRNQVDSTQQLDKLVAQAKQSISDAQSHQDLPFEQLVEALQPGRSISHSPLFCIVINHQHIDYRGLDNLPGLRFDGYSLGKQAAQFELVLDTVEQGDGSLIIRFTYARELFEPETIRRMGGHYVKLLQAIAEDAEQTVGEVVLLDESEQRQLDTWSRNETRYGSDVLVHQLFEQQAQAQPDAVALIFGDAQLSYGALNTRANRLAHHLIHLGIGPESRVGIAVERSLEMVIGLLAILKAGAAYVPLDPEYPQDRLAYMMQDSGIDLLLTQTRLAERLAPAPGLPTVWLDSLESWMPAGNDVSAGLNPDVRLHPEQLAYVIYTSGSTGRPKGAQLQHRNVVRLLAATEQWFHFGPQDVWTLFHSYAFDFSVWEMFGALCTGGRLVIVPYMVSRSPEEFLQVLQQQKVTVLNQTPSAFRQLLQLPQLYQQGFALRTVIFGGEALESESLRPWLDHFGDEAVELINMYGITETTVHVTYRRITRADLNGQRSPIGLQIPDLGLYVLDSHLNLCPIGVPGELHVAGAGLARGYLNRPGLTAERFIANPFNADAQGDGRLYRSGDLVRWRHDGELEYLGRIDHQVKIRGFRIELGEIEAQLLAYPGIAEAIAIPYINQGSTSLVAYVTPQISKLKADYYQDKLAARDEMIKQWQAVFDATYLATCRPGDHAGATKSAYKVTGPDFRGWNNSYDDQAIADDDMQAWLDETVDRIRALNPKHILEIGCGVGLLLQHLVPDAITYRGTDLSARAVADLQEWIKGQPQLAHVELRQEEAVASIVDASGFDTIIINSVAQYFPEATYLIEVLKGAAASLDAQGCIFVGDLRHLALQPAFHASVQLARAPEQLTAEQLLSQVEKAIAQEKELVLAPRFFEAHKAELGIAEIRILLKRSHYDNELTRYRYDVVLYRSAQVAMPVQDVPWVDIETLFAQLQEQPSALRVSGIPNRRLVRDLAAWQILQSASPHATVADLRQHIAQLESSGMLPETFWELGESHGYEVRISWSEGSSEGRFDVEFIDTACMSQADFPIASSTISQEDWHKHVNDPLAVALRHNLGSRLREHLLGRLPEYMVPAHFMVLEHMPQTASGKLDKNALPKPEATVTTLQYETPQGEIEEMLAAAWSEVLGIGRIGRHDNFFEIGGHSLIVIQITALLEQRHGLRLPMRRFFDHHTISALASVVHADMFIDRNAKAERLSQLDSLLSEFEV